jgi:signal transduction histidine kinase
VPRALALAVIYLAVIQRHAADRPGEIALLGVMAAHCALCVTFGRFNRVGSARFSAARTAAFTMAELACGFLSGWVNPVMLFILVNALTRDELDDRWARAAFVLSSMMLATFGLVHGVPAGEVFGLLIGGVVAHVALERRMSMTRNLVDDLAQRNDALLRAQAELQRLHSLALAQEKLSSLGMLAAGIAHEINNPMSYVTANVAAMIEALSTSQTTDPALREVIDELLPETLDGARRVNSIVAEIRLFARGDPQGMVEYDLNAQVQHAVRMVRGSLPPSCVVTVELGELPLATGFPQQIVQVLINILVNAADAGEPGEAATIQVRTWRDAEWLVAQVRDHGRGMAPEVCARLFQPFFTTKPAGKGNGLGLSVAYGIVQTHRGRIEVTSEVGQGSVFEVWLLAEPGLDRFDRAQRGTTADDVRLAA